MLKNLTFIQVQYQITLQQPDIFGTIQVTVNFNQLSCTITFYVSPKHQTLIPIFYSFRRVTSVVSISCEPSDKFSCIRKQIKLAIRILQQFKAANYFCPVLKFMEEKGKTEHTQQTFTSSTPHQLSIKYYHNFSSFTSLVIMVKILVLIAGCSGRKHSRKRLNFYRN